MALHDIERISRALREDMRLETLYSLCSAYGDANAALWLEHGQVQSLTYADYARMTRNCAAAIRTAVDAPQGSFVGISMDTCKEWFPIFWGVIQAGYNALLLDLSLNDEMTRYLLNQAGAKALISTKARALEDGVRWIEAQTLFDAPPAPEAFTPRYGDQVALCTSGTTGTSRVCVYNGRAVAEQVLSSELLYREQKRIAANAPRRAVARCARPSPLVVREISGRVPPGVRRAATAPTMSSSERRSSGSPPVKRTWSTPSVPTAIRARRTTSASVRVSAVGSHGRPSAGMQ